MPSSEKHLHIISFDIPYPPSYGGVIDIYYKLEALQQLGIKIHLHCYEYGRVRAKELNALCESVQYYKRSVFKNPFYGSLPYIVGSRNTKELLQNLLKDKYPILFEGLHTCYYLSDPMLADRIKVVRTHNVEHHYYSNLEKVESNYFKKYFFSREAARLSKFQSRLNHATFVAAISKADTIYFSKRYPQTFYLPPFHPNRVVNIKEGSGDFVLYHGNLSVGENDEAARYLVREVWDKNFRLPLFIAGNNPSKQLQKMCEGRSDIMLKANLDIKKIDELISAAHINLLPTFQATGIKLKLLNALFNGRFCIVNTPMVKNTGLESLCQIANDAAQFKKLIQDSIKKTWESSLDSQRKEILQKDFENGSSAKKLISNIWS